jgi:plasmid stability protein
MHAVHDFHMSTVSLQVRNVPEGVSRALKARATDEGKSLSEYVLELLLREAARPTRNEALLRIQRLSEVLPPADEPAWQTLHRMRGETMDENP